MIFRECNIVFTEIYISFYESNITLKRKNISKGERKIVIRELNKTHYLTAILFLE